MTKRYRIDYEFNSLELTPRTGYVYEFGVYSGKSLIQLIESYIEQKCLITHAFGFDSFEGLNLEETDKLNHDDWKDGAFDSRKIFRQRDPQRIANMFNRYFKRKFPSVETQIVRTWFKDIQYKSEMKPASYIHIDCDLYSSCLQALEFMFYNNLVVENTVINYNDIWWGDNTWTCGEGLAHTEIVEKYKVKAYTRESNVFVIQSYENPYNTISN